MLAALNAVVDLRAALFEGVEAGVAPAERDGERLGGGAALIRRECLEVGDTAEGVDGAGVGLVGTAGCEGEQEGDRNFDTWCHEGQKRPEMRGVQHGQHEPSEDTGGRRFGERS